MKTTALYNKHLSLGARMAPFGGYQMPIQYEGILAEHSATRTQATVFDTCHMGEFLIEGPQATADLEQLLSCPVGSMEHGQCRYGFLCNSQGGVIDDQILYRLGDERYMMVVNAGTKDGDSSWIREHLSSSTTFVDSSEQTAKLDLQGPAAPRIMQQLVPDSIAALKYYRFMHTTFEGVAAIVSRTGYTGEIGFEVYVDASKAEALWDQMIALGAKPAGLGARDTLRLEMCLPLYGHELNNQRNAAQSGFLRSIATDKQFIGSSMLLDESLRTQKLVALELDSRRAAREQSTVVLADGNQVGIVTSGSFAPSLGKAVALAYVDTSVCDAESELFIRSGQTQLAAKIVEGPFYKQATGRRKLADFL